MGAKQHVSLPRANKLPVSLRRESVFQEPAGSVFGRVPQTGGFWLESKPTHSGIGGKGPAWPSHRPEPQSLNQKGVHQEKDAPSHSLSHFHLQFRREGHVEKEAREASRRHRFSSFPYLVSLMDPCLCLGASTAVQELDATHCAARIHRRRPEGSARRRRKKSSPSEMQMWLRLRGGVQGSQQDWVGEPYAQSTCSGWGTGHFLQRVFALSWSSGVRDSISPNLRNHKFINPAS